MRNLVLVHCKRFFFRWETFAVTVWNLLMSFLSAYTASEVYFDQMSNQNYPPLFLAFIVLSLCGTMTSVILMENVNLSSGALRNITLGGYTKTQIFISKFIVIALFGLVEGCLFILPTAALHIARDMTATFIISNVMMYAAVSCVSMTAILLTERQSAAAACCIFGLFLLTVGSIQGANSLDEKEMKYSYSFTNPNELDAAPNLYYVPSPKREILEQAIRLSPMLPINEFVLWYMPLSELEYERWDTFVAPNKMAEISKTQFGEKMYRHKGRISLLPYYQISVLTVFCIGGTLIFRKRNLK